ncbi:MAG: cbb3-type cytochrome c oxidase subunit I, partial [Planctomycetota bacterium]
LAGVHYWWPKMFGKMYSEFWARLACLIIFVGFNMTFFPQFLLGTNGMPRRYAQYEGMAGEGGEKFSKATVELFTTLHQWSTIGSMVLGLGLFLAAGVLVASFFSNRRAPANPWGSATLEWKACSPPTHHNFEATPWVGSPYVYDNFVYDDEEEGYVELLPDLTRTTKPAQQPVAT